MVITRNKWLSGQISGKPFFKTLLFQTFIISLNYDTSSWNPQGQLCRPEEKNGEESPAIREAFFIPIRFSGRAACRTRESKNLRGCVEGPLPFHFQSAGAALPPRGAPMALPISIYGRKNRLSGQRVIM